MYSQINSTNVNAVDCVTEIIQRKDKLISIEVSMYDEEKKCEQLTPLCSITYEDLHKVLKINVYIGVQSQVTGG